MTNEIVLIAASAARAVGVTTAPDTAIPTLISTTTSTAVTASVEAREEEGRAMVIFVGGGSAAKVFWGGTDRLAAPTHLTRPPAHASAGERTEREACTWRGARPGRRGRRRGGGEGGGAINRLLFNRTKVAAVCHGACGQTPWRRGWQLAAARFQARSTFTHTQ